MIKHIVLFKVKENVPSAEIDDVFRAMEELRHHLPGIMLFSCGKNTSEMGLSDGFTHAMSMDFVDTEYLENVLLHPLHHKVVAKVKEISADNQPMLVVDYQIGQ